MPNTTKIKKYSDYLDSVRDELVAAETTVQRIKKSDEWLKCINYFNVLTNRGLLKTRPTKENGYRFELFDKDEYVMIRKDDLQSIVNEEQLKEISLKAERG